MSATSAAQSAQLPSALPSLTISTVTAAVSAAVDSVMKSRDERVVEQQERATMTSEQDNGVTSSECESTSTVSLHTASLVREDDLSEMEDASRLDETESVTDSIRRQSALVSKVMMIVASFMKQYCVFIWSVCLCQAFCVSFCNQSVCPYMCN